MIREIQSSELEALLELYLSLHETAIPEDTPALRKVWERILQDEDHHVIVCEADGILVSSCVCVIIPNLTRNARPYALIENVVTRDGYRRKGYGSACLRFAAETAKNANCYKVMLLTGSKDQGTLEFYRKNGFDSGDKTAFIQRFT
ncbi:MAG: GNAT family N-acetyltransferase [Oscillospiraceae bacterium]|nr:GNAT family N-acetyltransferase [Oscillospiraceae bacterium]